ncbi:hypothetical protein vseg_005289 [Gypsophila vaccaria]
MVGPCSYCGAYAQYCSHHHQCSTPNTNTNTNTNTNSGTYLWPAVHYEYESDYTSSSSPPVDCTLSLGTPSTRLSNNVVVVDSETITTKHRSSVSSFCWDLLHPNNKHSSSSTTTTTPNKSTPTHPTTNPNLLDPLFARRCTNCDTTSTPLWRNGPRGPKSLCNACGIRFKKEERRAAAATNNNSNNYNNNATSPPGLIDPHQGYYNAASWAHQATPQKMQCYGAPNEFRFMEDDRASDSGIQFLSWLTHDRPTGLVHDFTRS